MRTRLVLGEAITHHTPLATRLRSAGSGATDTTQPQVDPDRKAQN
jgi:hypothetical protein